MKSRLVLLLATWLSLYVFVPVTSVPLQEGRMHDVTAHGCLGARIRALVTIGLASWHPDLHSSLYGVL